MFRRAVQNRPIIFLPVESTPRELDYKINIARLFCQEKFDVVIGNPPFIRDELKYKNYKGIFLEKGMNPDPDYYEQLINKSIIVYCLSDEGASHPAFSVTYPPAIAALKKAELIFLWGDFQKKDLVSRNDDPELNKKYRVTGYPGLDLSLPKYKNYHSQLRSSSFTKEYILVNTNFASVNGYSFEEVLKACNAMSPETKNGMQESYEREKKSFSTFQTWLEEIFYRFSDQQFFIRPHPVERSDSYDQIARKYKNVRVCRDGNALQAISGAKLVIHNDCTTALQSYLANVPVISLAYPNIRYVHSHWALEFGAKPKSINEAIFLISQILETGHFTPDLLAHVHRSAQIVLSQWFKNIGNSTQKVVESMLSHARSTLDNFQPAELKDARSRVQKIKVFVRKFLPLHYKVPIVARAPLSKFTPKDISQRLNLLNEINGKNASYEVKKLFPNTYLIREKECT